MLQTVRRARRVSDSWGLLAAGGLAVLVLLAVAPGGVRAQAVDGLPGSILEKNGAWNAAEVRQVEAFIADRLAVFADESADAEAVAQARDALLVPLNDLRAVVAFQSQYFRALSAALREGLSTFIKVGRINAMMLGGRIVDASVVPLLETGVTDEAPGVRFAAARSLLAALTNETIGLRGAEQTRLIEKLGTAAATETNGFVAGKFIEGIRVVEVPARREILLAVFNARVPLHAADPSLAYQPELTAMQELFIAGLGQPGGFPRDAARTFVQAAARYLRLTTRQLADGGLSPANTQAAGNLARQSYTVLTELSANLGQPGQRPADPVRFLPSDLARAAELAEQWVAYLAPGPVNLTADDLDIAAPGTPDASDAPEAEG